MPVVDARAEAMAQLAQEKLDRLAKPVGSLGRLEALAVRLCVAQTRCPPLVNNTRVIVFAADHGIQEENVSPFPSSVTRAMVQTIVEGKASVSCLAKIAGARLEVVNVGVAGGTIITRNQQAFVDYYDFCISEGTKNICREAAMTHAQLQLALKTGRDSVDRALAKDGAYVVSVGELGICNSSIAAALACRLLGLPAEVLVGPGTGVDAEGRKRKVDAVHRALARDASQAEHPLSCLQDLGGFEVAAMVGCFLQCYERKVVAVVDGFIASVAALVASKVNPLVENQFIFSSLSAEPGHRYVLQGFTRKQLPLLHWDLRLGEASAATLCLPLIKASGRLLVETATLEEVMVSAAGSKTR